jgi:dehydrogenase/reductase SDR family protein 12
MSALADAIDAALECSLVGSFTRIGSAVRRRLEHWAPLEGHDLQGRVVVITGGTSGLGLQAARALAQLGATIEIIARDADKAASTCAALTLATGNPHVHFVHADLADLAAVRRAATQLLQRHAAIDVLIHNAGALDDVHHLSPDGIEFTVASQVVGPFLLTGLLLPALRAKTPSRVLWVVQAACTASPWSSTT